MFSKDKDVDDLSVLALRNWAAFVMTLGPGAAIGFYVAMVGFYVENFESRIFFIAMVFCSYGPAPVVAILQEVFDRHFDEVYSPAVTYFFRVVLLQLVLATVTLFWLLMPQTPWLVLVVGVVIGIFSSVPTISAFQMVAAMDPGASSYAMIGNLLGGALPVPIFFLLGFGPNSTMSEFRLVLLTVPTICLASSFILSYMHLQLDVFQKSYDRLGYDINQIPREQGTDEMVRETPVLVRESTPTEPLVPVEDGQVPTWVWAWCWYTAKSTVLTVTVMCLVSFIGAPNYAQWLSLGKLAMDLLGGLVSVMLPQLACFEQGPWHKTLVSAGALRLALLFLLMMVFAGIACPYKNWTMVWSVWFLFHIIHGITQPHISVTIGFYVLVKDRKRVLRMNTAGRFVGAVVGVVIAAMVVVPLLGLGVNWPPMDRVVPEAGAAAQLVAVRAASHLRS